MFGIDCATIMGYASILSIRYSAAILLKLVMMVAHCRHDNVTSGDAIMSIKGATMYVSRVISDKK